MREKKHSLEKSPHCMCPERVWKLYIVFIDLLLGAGKPPHGSIRHTDHLVVYLWAKHRFFSPNRTTNQLHKSNNLHRGSLLLHFSYSIVLYGGNNGDKTTKVWRDVWFHKVNVSFIYLFFAEASKLLMCDESWNAELLQPPVRMREMKDEGLRREECVRMLLKHFHIYLSVSEISPVIFLSHKYFRSDWNGAAKGMKK